MTADLFTPRALRELRAAAEWIAEDNPDAADNLLSVALDAAKRLTTKPSLGRVELRLARPDTGFGLSAGIGGPVATKPKCSSAQ